MPKNYVVTSTEKSVLGVLMQAPYLRGEVLKKYPGRFENFFSAKEAKQLLRVIMGTNGWAYPASVDPQVPDLIGTDWAPQLIFDASAFDAVDRFWTDVELLRKLAKGRRAKKTLVDRSARLDATEHDQIDTFVSETGAEISALVSESSSAHDPTMPAVQAKYQLARSERRLGTKASTMIPVLDEKLGGGFRINPGELVVFSGKEKQRKTTILKNIISSWHRGGLEGGTAWICNEQSTDSVYLLGELWALEATRLCLERGLTFRDPMDQTRELGWTLSADDVMDINGFSEKFQGRIPQVFQSIQDAYELVGTWNLRFYCAGLDDGNAMDAEAVCARVRTDIEFNGVTRVVVDNFQGWLQSTEKAYDVMVRTVPLVDAFTGTYHCLVIGLSQKSRNDQIMGGGGIEGRAQLVVDMAYDEVDSPNIVTMKRTYGRNRGYFKVEVRIDPKSGLIVEGMPYAHLV